MYCICLISSSIPKSDIDSDSEVFNIDSHKIPFYLTETFKLLVFLLTLQSFLKCPTFPQLKRLDWHVKGFLPLHGSLLVQCSLSFINSFDIFHVFLSYYDKSFPYFVFLLLVFSCID